MRTDATSKLKHAGRTPVRLRAAPSILALLVALVACGALYFSQMKLQGALRANRALSELVVNGDAQLVELARQRYTGDIIVRINGQHYHEFREVCSPNF